MRARRAVAVALTIALVLGIWAMSSRAMFSAPEPLARAVDGVTITVSDMERAGAFYEKVLFFQKVSDIRAGGAALGRLTGVPGREARIVRMRLGAEHIDLVQYVAPPGRPVPADSQSNDRWFQHIAIIVNDMDQAYLWLRRHHVPHVSPEPQRLPDWNRHAAGIRAFYFKDPDDHVLEILQFPPDKGDPRWQRPSDMVFLGIDHTAIVVADTDRSVAFYRDVLGLRVAGTSENSGPEQERLNNVRGARLRITTLRATTGPAIELLEYLAPRDGRDWPAGTHANDLTHWQTRIVVDSAGAARRFLGSRLTEPSPTVARPGGMDTGHAFSGRDPDGHALLFGER